MSLTVGLISLGCPKNLIDSEIMIGHLQKAGMTMTPDAELADVMVVNTCAFIDQAKQEAIDAILDVVRARESGTYPENQKLIVAGCLSQRFHKELPALLPEVDAFIGPDQITRLPEIITEVMNRTVRNKNFVEGKCKYVPDWETPRYRLTPPHSAYIKIAEGCNHGCAYCIIPMIRGRHRSRSQEDVVREAEALVRAGVKEINLIAQDITYYGMDKWTDARPNRRSAVDSSRGESLASLIRALNAIEGEYDHQELMEFIEEFRFERAGIFTFSREEGTRAYNMPDQVHHRTKARRYNEATMLLTRIASEIGQKQIGRQIRVLVDAPGTARTEWDAPDIDGTVSVPLTLPVGEFATVTVTDAVAYELTAE